VFLEVSVNTGAVGVKDSAVSLVVLASMPQKLPARRATIVAFLQGVKKEYSACGAEKATYIER